MIFILKYRDYIHVVPFVIDKDDNIIIKTVFPSRNFHKIYKESGAVAHEAKVVLVFLDTKTNRPVRAPEKLVKLLENYSG
jgi:hypothetical protein